MTRFWKIVSLGIVAVLVFDTVASFASIWIGFPYAYASIGSILIYGTVGYVIYRHSGLARAVAAAILVELVDATLGWFISWQIGPGALPVDQATTPTIAAIIAFVLVAAAICALMGSAIARVLHGRPNSNA